MLSADEHGAGRIEHAGSLPQSGRGPGERGAGGEGEDAGASARPRAQTVHRAFEHVGQLEVERVADRGEQVGRDLLGAAFDLGEVRERDRRSIGDVGQRALLVVTLLAQHVTDQRAQARFGGRGWRALASAE